MGKSAMNGHFPGETIAMLDSPSAGVIYPFSFLGLGKVDYTVPAELLKKFETWPVKRDKPWENHRKTMGKWWFNGICLWGYTLL